MCFRCRHRECLNIWNDYQFCMCSRCKEDAGQRQQASPPQPPLKTPAQKKSETDRV